MLSFSTHRNWNTFYLFKQIQNIIQIIERMQVCTTLSPQFNQLQLNLSKTASMPSFQPFPNQQASHDFYYSLNTEHYWNKSIKLILKLKKQIKISKASLFLAISYMGRLVIDYNFQLNQKNYEKISVSLVLISAKMLEIYPPKISVLLSKCSRYYTKEQMVEIEGQILEAFNYDVSFSETSYSYIHRQMEHETQDKLEDAEKLLGLALSEQKVAQNGEYILSLAIVSLIKPSMLREIDYELTQKVKNTASKIYSLYLANKSKK